MGRDVRYVVTDLSCGVHQLYLNPSLVSTILLAPVSTALVSLGWRDRPCITFSLLRVRLPSAMGSEGRFFQRKYVRYCCNVAQESSLELRNVAPNWILLRRHITCKK